MVVEPSRSIVLLGPNGVGKTRFAVDVVQRNNPRADRISANRHIALKALPRQSDSDLKSNSTSAIQQQINEYWEVHNEYTYLMAEILEEDKSASQKFRALTLEGKLVPENLVQTRLQKITQWWQALFPGRTLQLDYTPQVLRAGEQPYSTGRMSEGERTALYLITRLVSSNKSIILVDEPEIHFHPLLAREFWNQMERHKEDTLFIYVTHDIPFALSRKNPRLYVVRSPGTFDEIVGDNLPDDAVDTILGAASFSIAATRLVFCEGVVGQEDHALFSAWYSCPKTAVIPVGGCAVVKQCVEVFNSQHATSNVTAVGHIDRDDWPDTMLDGNAWVKAVPINEIEGIICYEPIFKALAAFYNKSDPNALYASFVAGSRSTINPGLLHKHVLNRAKLILELKQKEMRNAVNPHASFATMKSDYLAAVTSTAHAETILNDELATMQAALSIPEEMLRKFPAKTYQNAFAPLMQVQPTKAFEDICAVLKSSDESLKNEQSKLTLKNAIIAALSPHLFARTI